MIGRLPPTIRLPAMLQRSLEATANNLLHPRQGRTIDFSRPVSEEALVPPDSVSWRIFKNPIALFVGGVAAVILELAEPSVRSGVWDHSSFRRDALGRLRRTGLAAMVTVYGPRSVALPMIARRVRIHAGIAGTTPAGAPYAANDPRLLTWVHTTAAFGFAEAYSRYVEPLSRRQFDAYYREGAPAAQAYGAPNVPRSDCEVRALIAAMRGRLEPSPAVMQFLQVMRETPAFPAPLVWLQAVLARAAVELLPIWVRDKLSLTAEYGLRRQDRPIMRLAGAFADRIVLRESPAVQSCLRLGLPADYLYTRAARGDLGADAAPSAVKTPPTDGAVADAPPCDSHDGIELHSE